MNTQSSKSTIIWTLPLLAALLYLACVPWAEIRGSDEAVFATVAREMIASGNFLHPTFQGQTANIFPLYPWLICLFSGFHAPGVLAIRLPAVLAVFAMAFQAYLVARRHRGIPAGTLAALIVLTSFGAMRVGIFGQAETLHAALLSGAWLSWHSLGALQRRWRLAWGVSLGLVFLDTMAVGLRGVLLFYLPLLFTSMPPRTRRLLRSREHLWWLAAYALVLYVWVGILCPQPLLGWNAMVGSLSGSAVPEGAVRHFFAFPARCLRDYLPWSVFIWVPFCLALRPLEPPGSLCGFLRTAVLTLFICHWMLPGYSSLLMMPALPAMAIMTSFNLPIVMYRQERGWRRTNRLLCVAAVAGLLYSALAWTWVTIGRVTFENCPESSALRTFGFALTIILVTLAVAVAVRGGNPDPRGLAWCMAGFRIVWVVLLAIPAALTIGDREAAARSMLGIMEVADDDQPRMAPVEIPEGETVYLLSERHSFPAQMFYLGHPVARLDKGASLPTMGDVYLVSATQPVFLGWNWERLSGPVDFHQHRRLVPAVSWCDLPGFLWNHERRQYARVRLGESEYPEHASEYFRPQMMSLYRGVPVKQ